jgi:hypothetical protein
LRDGFDTDTRANYTVLRTGGGQPGTVSIGGGELRFGNQDYFTVLRSNTGQRAPYSTVIVDVKSLVGPGTGPEDSVFAGLFKDERNYVTAFYNNRSKIAGFDVVRDGVVYGLGFARNVNLTPPFRFAFVANENEVTALVSDGSSFGFRPLIKRDVLRARNASGQSVLDLRDPTVLAEYKNSFGARADTGGTIVYDRVEAGYYGEAGLRDPHVIQYADGTPYIKDNKLYFTFTNAGLGFFEKAHWGVWTLDLADTTKLEQVGNLFFRRSFDGKVLGHHAGQVVFDEEENRWIVLVSTWGDFGEQGGTGGERPVDVEYAELPGTVDLLNGVQVLETRLHPLNSLRPSPGKWDPGLTRIDGTWYVAFVIANRLFGDFQPALAKSAPGGDHDTQLTLVGTDESKNATEGPIIQKLGGQWRVLASNGDDSPPELDGLYPMYDLNMRFVGNLKAEHPTNIPHPMIVPVSSGGSTKYILVTFNGTQYAENILGYGTHGDTFVMEAAQRVRGNEFDPR